MSDPIEQLITDRLDEDLGAIVVELVNSHREGEDIGLAEVIVIAYKKGVEAGSKLTIQVANYISE